MNNETIEFYMGKLLELGIRSKVTMEHFVLPGYNESEYITLEYRIEVYAWDDCKIKKACHGLGEAIKTLQSFYGIAKTAAGKMKHGDPDYICPNCGDKCYIMEGNNHA